MATSFGVGSVAVSVSILLSSIEGGGLCSPSRHVELNGIYASEVSKS